MQVSKWGNSLDVRLPAAVVEVLELKEGDDVEIRVAGARELVVSRTPDRDALRERLRAFRLSTLRCLFDAVPLTVETHERRLHLAECLSSPSTTP